jgi:capsule polysaccharide export protein KpsE/RkpR
VLKESIEATQQAAESSARNLAEKDQLVNQLQTANASAREQVAVWEDAVKQRDERIQALDADLGKTRARLDEAIQRLKESGAR